MTTPTSELATYRRLFDEKFRQLDQLLAGLSPEGLLWKPFEGEAWGDSCNPVGWIAAHSISSTIFLLRRAEYTLQRREWADVDGDRGAFEFSEEDHDASALQERAQAAQIVVAHFLETLDGDDLDEGGIHPIAQRPITVRYDIQHAIEHMAQHIGHGQITRQLWEARGR